MHTRKAAATTVACEENAQQAETAANIDGGKTTCSTSSDVPVPLIIPSLFAPLPKPRSSSTKGLFVGPPGTGKICLSKYRLCCQSSIPTYLFWWCPDEAEIRAQRSIYVVSGPGLVQTLCKTSTSCIDPVILFDKDDKIGQSDIH